MLLYVHFTKLFIDFAPMYGSEWKCVVSSYANVAYGNTGIIMFLWACNIINDIRQFIENTKNMIRILRWLSNKVLYKIK